MTQYPIRKHDRTNPDNGNIEYCIIFWIDSKWRVLPSLTHDKHSRDISFKGFRCLINEEEILGKCFHLSIKKSYHSWAIACDERPPDETDMSIELSDEELTLEELETDEDDFEEIIEQATEKP